MLAFAVFVAVGALIFILLIKTGGIQPVLTEESVQISAVYEDATHFDETADILESVPSFSPEPLCTPEPKEEPGSVVLLSDYATLLPGDDNQSVLILQDRLVELGYMEADEPSTVYNSSVETAVMRFQRSAGLEITGIADAEMQTLLFSENAPFFRIQAGDSGDDVAAAQQRLHELGYYFALSTGYYGPQTEDAVRAFEYQNGLPVDGILDISDWKQLFSYQAGPNLTAEAGASSLSLVDEGDTLYAYSAEGLTHAASDQVDKPYVWGKDGPDAFDSPGLIRYCLMLCGISVGKTEPAGYAEIDGWQQIEKVSLLKKGDILFFKSDASAQVMHIGICIGSSYFVHASSSSGKVVISSLSEPYWERNFVFARRIFNG